MKKEKPPVKVPEFEFKKEIVAGKDLKELLIKNRGLSLAKYQVDENVAYDFLRLPVNISYETLCYCFENSKFEKNKAKTRSYLNGAEQFFWKARDEEKLEIQKWEPFKEEPKKRRKRKSKDE